MIDRQDLDGRISGALLALRLGVFVVMLMWTLDKFVAPAHAAAYSRASTASAGWMRTRRSWSAPRSWC